MRKLFLFLFCIASESILAQTSFSYRYWFDNKCENAVIGNTIGTSLNADIDTKGLTPGIHRFNYQILNGGKGESSVKSCYFNKTSNIGKDNIRLFVDGKSIDTHLKDDNTTDNNINLSIDAKNIDYGFHTLEARIIDNNAGCVATSATHFIKTQSPNLSEMITQLLIDDNNVNNIQVDKIEAQSADLAVDVSNLGLGAHNISINLLMPNKVCTSVAAQNFLLDNTRFNGITQYRCWIDNNEASMLQETFAPPQPNLVLNNLYALNPHPTLTQNNFHFAIKENQPLIYAKGMFNFCATDQRGMQYMKQSDFIDMTTTCNVHAPIIAAVDSITYLKNRDVDKYGIAWYSFYVEEGDKVSITTDRKCSLQVFEATEGNCIYQNNEYADAQLNIKNTGMHYIALYNAPASTVGMTFYHNCINGNCTPVHNIELLHEAKSEMYDIDGRIVTHPHIKGIYIKNGKKIVVK